MLDDKINCYFSNHFGGKIFMLLNILLISDADFAVRLDPNNQELRKQYTEVKALCDKVCNIQNNNILHL